jgi:hypothetical protein
MARTRAHGRSGSRSRFGRRSGRNTAAVTAVEFFTRPEQNIVWQILGFLVRARAELTVITVLVTVALIGREQIGPDAAFLVTAATTLVVFAVPASRRYVNRRVWCVLTRHRMRACFTQTRTMTMDGRMPFLLWSRPSPVGERIRVWLPAGLSVKDLDQITAQLATACWAREARVQGSRSQAAYVLVDVVRRDPLASSMVRSTVIDDLDAEDFGDDSDGTIVPLPDRAVLPPVPDTAPDPVTNGQRPTKKPATMPAHNGSTPDDLDDSADRVTGFGGVDVSDYV